MEPDKDSGKNLSVRVRIIKGVIAVYREWKAGEPFQRSSYVVVQYGDLTKKTTRKYRTTFPTWDQTLSFDLTPIRKLKITMFFQDAPGKEKRVSKIKQKFDVKGQQEITYTKDMLTYSIQVAPEPNITPQPTIPSPTPKHKDFEWDEEDISDELPEDPPAQSDPPQSDPEPAPRYQVVQRVFEAVQPATPGALLDSLVKTLVETQRTKPHRCEDALGEICLYGIFYLIAVVCIIFMVIFVLVTRMFN